METLEMTTDAGIVAASLAQPEEELMQAAVQGDAQAFETIMAMYQNRVKRQCMRRGLSADEAEDVTQDVFIKVFRSLERYCHQNSFGTWLYRVAENACIDFCRQRQRRWAVIQPMITDADGQEMEFTGRIADPENHHDAAEVETRIAGALAGLSPLLRDAFEMKELEGLRYEQIASRLDVTLGTVKSRIHRARRLLTEQLQDLV